MITNLYNYQQKLRLADPFFLLQDDLYGPGGQITIKNLAPGFEMTAFLAQATGAIVFTDSPSRWGEMLKAQSKEQLASGSNWEALIGCIKGQRYPFTVNVYRTAEWRNEGKMGLMKQTWQDILNAVTAQEGVDIKRVTERLSLLLAKACKVSPGELPPEKDPASGEMEDFTIFAEFDCIIPAGGIIHNTVQRLLVTCGVQGYMKGVPMVIFARPAVY